MSVKSYFVISKQYASMVVGNRDVAHLILAEIDHGTTSGNILIQQFSLSNDACSLSTKGDMVIRVIY